SGQALATSTETVVDNGSYSSAAFTANTNGVYHWIASYGGDGNNNGAGGSCGDSNEVTGVGRLTATPATPRAQGPDAPGRSLTGAGRAPTGTVPFCLCSPAQLTAGPCSAGGTQVGDPVTLAGGKATSAAATSTLVVGTYCWRAVYSGDSFYGSSSDSDAATE